MAESDSKGLEGACSPDLVPDTLEGPETVVNGTMHSDETDEDVEVIEDTGMTAVFPPPMSWYNAHAADGRDEMFVYISFNRIVIGRIDPDILKNPWPKFSLILQKDSFSCISLEKSEWSKLTVKDSPIATGDVKGMVKIWNVKDKSSIHHNGHEKSGTKVVDVKWSRRTASLVYSADARGGLCIWNVKDRSLKTLRLEAKWDVCCIAVSDHHDEILAIGESGGNILILSTEKDIPVPLHKMHHEEGLIALEWVPDDDWSGVKLEPEHTRPLLVSTVHALRKPNIRVWDSEGHQVAMIPLEDEDESLQMMQRYTDKTFVPIAWINSPVTNQKELYIGLKQRIGSWKTVYFDETYDIHKDPTIFAIVQTGDILWSLGREAMIVGWHLRSSQKHCIIPMIGGICYVQSSQAEPEIVAMGGSDGVLRILSMKEGYPLKNCDAVPTLTIRPRSMQCKVTAVSWHPEKHDLIALGTDVGAVATYQFGDGNRYTKVFDNRVKGAVYSIGWGPEVYTQEYFAKTPRVNKALQVETPEDESKHDSGAKKGNPLMLYVCADNEVKFIRLGNRTNEFRGIRGIIRALSLDERGSQTQKVTEMRWCPDRKFLCLGFFDGRIDIFEAPFLKLRCRIRCHTRALQYISWRPYDFGDSVSMSKWMASAANDGLIRLYNMARLYEDDLFLEINSPAVTLDGHNSIRVISLAWSPFNPKLLVSVSYDWSAVVWEWNTTEATPIARFRSNNQRLVACLFHPSEKDLVITCSDEMITDSQFAVQVWDIKEHPYCSVSEASVRKVKNKVLTLKHERVTKELEATQLEQIVETNDASASACYEPTYQPKTIYVLSDGNNNSDKNSELSLLASVNPLSAVNTENLKESIISIRSSDDSVQDTVLAKRSKMLIREDECEGMIESIVRPKMEAYIEEGKWEQAIQLGQWIGATSKIVDKAIERENVTRSVAELVARGDFSSSIRAEIRRLYVKHLRSTGDVNGAVEYLLRSELIPSKSMKEATDIYTEHKLFEEAYVLIKCCVDGPFKTVLLKNTLQKWIAHLTNVRDFAKAVYILMCANDSNGAYGVIDEWNDRCGWEVGLALAMADGNDELTLIYGGRCIQEYLKREMYAEAFSLVSKCSHLAFAEPLIHIYEWLKNNGLKRTNAPDIEKFNDFTMEGKGNELREKFSNYKNFETSLNSFMKTLIPQVEEEAILLMAKFLTIKWAGFASWESAKSNIQSLLDNFLDKDGTLSLEEILVN